MQRKMQQVDALQSEIEQMGKDADREREEDRKTLPKDEQERKERIRRDKFKSQIKINNDRVDVLMKEIKEESEGLQNVRTALNLVSGHILGME